MSRVAPTSRVAVATRLLVLGAGAVLAIAAARQPDWNLDCVAYAGAAQAWLGASPEALHDSVYAEVGQSATPQQARAILAGSAYRKTLARNANSFATQLPFYANKPGYVALVAMASRLGVPSVRATFLVSAIAYGLLSILVLSYLLQLVRPAVAWALSACLLLSPPVRELGVLATPDAVSTVLLFAGAGMLALERGPQWLAASVLVLSIAVRPDNVLFCLALFAWLLADPARRRLAVTGAIAALGASVACAWLTQPYSFSALIAHTFLDRLTTSQDIAAAAITPAQYAGILQRGVLGEGLVHPSLWPLFALLSVVSWSACPAGDRERWRNLALQASIWLALLAHFAAFPLLADRFFVAHYLLIAVLAIATDSRLGLRRLASI
jgi:hypothetical protein